MTAPIVNPATRTPINADTVRIAANFLGNADLCRDTTRRMPGQLWSRLAERAEAHA